MKKIFQKNRVLYVIPYLLLFGTMLSSGVNTSCYSSWKESGSNAFVSGGVTPGDYGFDVSLEGDDGYIVYVNRNTDVSDAASGLHFEDAVATIARGLEIMKEIRARMPLQTIVMWIAPATYDEPISLTDSDFSNTFFMGTGLDTIIRSPTSSATATDNVLSISGLSDIIFTNMTLQHIGDGTFSGIAANTSAAVSVTNSSGIELLDLEIKNSFYQGLDISGSTSNVTVSNLTFTGVQNADTATSTSAASYAIRVRSSATAYISDLIFTENYTHFITNDSATVTLTDVDFVNATTGSGVGLYVKAIGSTTTGAALTFSSLEYPVFSENAGRLDLDNIDIQSTNTNGLIACQDGAYTPASLIHTIDDSILSKDTQAGEVFLNGAGNTVDGSTWRSTITNADVDAILSGDFLPANSTVTFTCAM